MNTLEQIKHDFEQNHYRKQREWIDAGEVDYWKLSKENRRGIVNQCKEEAEKYPELRWLARSHDGINYGDSEDTPPWAFSSINLFYRRIDPLPTEGITINFEKAIDAKDEQIKELSSKLKDREEDLKGLEDSINRLEKKLSQQKNLAKVADDASTNRLNQITELNNELQKLYDALENKDIIIEDYQVSEASLYRDIRTLAMRQP